METKIYQIMTKDTIAVFDDGLRSEALNIMVSKKIRHLPVIFNNENYIGLLDLTKLVFDRLEFFENKIKSMEKMMETLELLERTGAIDEKKAQAIRKKNTIPDVNYVLDIKKLEYDKGTEIPVVNSEYTVSNCAKVMKDGHVAGCIVVDEDKNGSLLKGLITTKDFVRKVIHPNLNHQTVKVSEIMVIEKINYIDS